MIISLFYRLKFLIKPPKIYKGEYWWVNGSRGTPLTIYINEIDCDIVKYRYTNGNTGVAFTYKVRWIRPCQFQE